MIAVFASARKPQGKTGGKMGTLRLDKCPQTCIIEKSKRDDKASFVKPAHSEREAVQALSPRHEAATLEQSARSGTIHPRYRMT